MQVNWQADFQTKRNQRNELKRLQAMCCIVPGREDRKFGANESPEISEFHEMPEAMFYRK
jgi:hypothetical protein